jgi:hypothetical protein
MSSIDLVGRNQGTNSPAPSASAITDPDAPATLVVVIQSARDLLAKDLNGSFVHNPALTGCIPA